MVSVAMPSWGNDMHVNMRGLPQIGTMVYVRNLFRRSVRLVSVRKFQLLFWVKSRRADLRGAGLAVPGFRLGVCW